MNWLCVVVLVYIHGVVVLVLCIGFSIVILIVVFPSGSHFAGGVWAADEVAVAFRTGLLGLDDDFGYCRLRLYHITSAKKMG